MSLWCLAATHTIINLCQLLVQFCAMSTHFFCHISGSSLHSDPQPDFKKGVGQQPSHLPVEPLISLKTSKLLWSRLQCPSQFLFCLCTVNEGKLQEARQVRYFKLIHKSLSFRAMKFPMFAYSMLREVRIFFKQNLQS